MNKRVLLIIPFFMIFSFCKNKTKEQKFWDWFSKNNLTYYNEVEGIDTTKPLFQRLNAELKKVNSELTWEFSPIKDNGIREFTVSADGIRELFPAVEKLVLAAPEIPNWKINAFRQRIPGEDLRIDFGEFSISYSDIFFKYEDEGEKIGIELYIKDFDGEGQKQNAIYILLDGLIGEYDTETVISWIDWKKLNELETGKLFKFHELRNLVDQKKVENHN
ncbi:hypothetical protein [Flagellimonas onchidii]|uniref:hypothetical protein n=1 Tax=Flagellimonas onchidii TaxID=2562684 RepID=UPI0010A5CA44|nr:hypothetical protein [Allomuricauda onchidii]